MMPRCRARFATSVMTVVRPEPRAPRTTTGATTPCVRLVNRLSSEANTGSRPTRLVAVRRKWLLRPVTSSASAPPAFTSTASPSTSVRARSTSKVPAPTRATNERARLMKSPLVGSLGGVGMTPPTMAPRSDAL